MGLMLTETMNNPAMQMIVYFVAFFGIIYLFILRPQQKEKKKQDELLNNLAIGDGVLTTAGFYGEVIDITQDIVIVEFGNNKNCRIPMQKQAIVKSEKPKFKDDTKKD